MPATFDEPSDEDLEAAPSRGDGYQALATEAVSAVVTRPMSLAHDVFLGCRTAPITIWRLWERTGISNALPIPHDDPCCTPPSASACGATAPPGRPGSGDVLRLRPRVPSKAGRHLLGDREQPRLYFGGVDEGESRPRLRLADAIAGRLLAGGETYGRACGSSEAGLMTGMPLLTSCYILCIQPFFQFSFIV